MVKIFQTELYDLLRQESPFFVREFCGKYPQFTYYNVTQFLYYHRELFRYEKVPSKIGAPRKLYYSLAKEAEMGVKPNAVQNNP
jgi:hypothetical protein